MADVIEVNVQTGEKTTRSYTQEEKDNIVAMQPTTDEKWVRVRQDRTQLLKDTDYAALPDSPEMTSEMASYRQALRNITTQSDVDNITWPTKP